MPAVTIDGRRIEVHTGQTILEAAKTVGVVIPTLCHHADLKPVGSCRLCLVEVEGLSHQVPACASPAEPDMIVHTDTPSIVHARKFVLESFLQHYIEPAGQQLAFDSEFMHWVRHYGVNYRDDRPAPRYQPDSDSHPFIRVDLNQCILCTRCVRACEEVQGCFVWKLGARGVDTRIVAGTGQTMLEAGCESCGACAAYCPTGALLDRSLIGEVVVGEKPAKIVRTTCCYCGVGCLVDLHVRENRISAASAQPGDTLNGMSLCVKGRYGNGFVHHPDRLRFPRVRSYLLESTIEARPEHRDGWVEVRWDTALDIVARKLAAIRRESGSDAIGFLASAKCTNEENYLVQKLARQVIGTNNIDHCARLCHSSTVAGLTMALGSGAMSNSMHDLAEHAVAMFVIGSNTTEQHPVFGAMIREAVLKRSLKLVVADPRRIPLADFATLHLRQRPGTDVALLNGIMHIVLERGWQDRAFIAERCEGFDELANTLSKYPPQHVAELTGVPESQLQEAAEILGTNRPMAVVWAMGITQHTTGVLNVLSLANMQMLLGNFGVPGSGVNPLRGQNNVQGACDMGALPNVFSGYRPVSDSDSQLRFTSAWQLRSSSGTSWQLPWQTGLTVTEMIDAAGSGIVRGLYILGENPAVTDPDTNHVRARLARAEFVVLQELFASDTAEFADVLLPGAAFAEKSGTFTNTDRHVQLIRPAVDPPGEARPDWQIISELAARMLRLFGLEPVGVHGGWAYQNPSVIMDEIAAVTTSYAGLSHGRLERGERLQWPVIDAHHPGTPILHVDQFPRGRGLFHAVDHLAPAELPDGEFPLLLTTGRVLYHWHAGEMTRRVSGLISLYPQSLVEVSPEDATRLNLVPEQRVRVVTRRGEMMADIVITPRVPQGIIFGTFHFPGEGNVNNLTHAALDSIAKIPEYKVCAARLEAAPVPVLGSPSRLAK